MHIMWVTIIKFSAKKVNTTNEKRQNMNNTNQKKQMRNKVFSIMLETIYP